MSKNAQKSKPSFSEFITKYGNESLTIGVVCNGCITLGTNSLIGTPKIINFTTWTTQSIKSSMTLNDLIALTDDFIINYSVITASDISNYKYTIADMFNDIKEVA